MHDLKKIALPSPSELKKNYPLDEARESFIAKSRDTIKQILDGSDPRILLVVGPCSIHDTTGALEYAQCLKNLSDEVSDSFFIVMRCYIEKSRTSFSWKGFVNDPHLNNSYDIVEGLKSARSLLLELTSMEIPAAAELLDPLTIPYYADLLSWGCIGARTSESQPHRLMASGQQLPISFKNSTGGNIQSAVNGAFVASQPHTFLGIQEDGRLGIQQTKGNPDAHITLRGGVNGPNYDKASIQSALQCLSKTNMPLKIIVDCSHGNSNEDYTKQSHVFNSVLQQIAEGQTAIRGLILESHLFSGNQTVENAPLRYATSITDPCLDWNTTENLVREGRSSLLEAFQNAAISGVLSS